VAPLCTSYTAYPVFGATGLYLTWQCKRTNVTFYQALFIHFVDCCVCHNACVLIRKMGLIGTLNVRNILPVRPGNSWHSVECRAGLQRDKANKCCIVGVWGLRFVATAVCLKKNDVCVSLCSDNTDTVCSPPECMRKKRQMGEE